MIETTILAILQGIAEFLPISSSGHLVLGQELLDVNAPGMRLDIMLHLGTLVSIAVFYWMVIWRILRNFEIRYIGHVVLSALPAVAVYLVAHDFLESAFESARMVGYALLFTGAILLMTRWLAAGDRAVTWRSALLMGCAQAVALIPGVSRSGSTLVAARCAKVNAEKSAEFSFLMSAPLIMGAALLEVVKSLMATTTDTAPEISWSLATYGAAVAAVVGYFSLKLLLKSLKSDKFWLFGIYCLIVGTLTLIKG